MKNEKNKSTKKKTNLKDKFFKEVFSNPEVTLDLLKHHLPKKLYNKIDKTTLKLTNKSFITEEYNEKHSDLIFKCQIEKSSSYIYFLIESQTTNDKHMGIRLLEYNTQLIRQHIQENKTTKAPIILNILIYAGKKPYSGPKNLIEIFENQELAKQVMFKDIHLVDLQATEDERITKDEKAAFAQLLLKYSIFRDFIKLFESQMETLKKVIPHLPYLDRAITYIFLSDTGKNEEKLLNLLREATRNEEKVMTLAQKIENRGEKKGIQKGIQKGIFQTAKNLLEMKLDESTIKKATGLSIKEIEELKKQK